MVRTRAGAAALAIAAITAAGSLAVPTAGAEDTGGTASFHQLYREDANAVFVAHHGGCADERTQVGLSFHHDHFRSDTEPRHRSVQFGISIQEFDCGSQLLAVYEGVDSTPHPFDVEPGLAGAAADATMTVCQTFPAAGECFPVDVLAHFDGVGRIDIQRHRTRIKEPDCTIVEKIFTRGRAAHVWAKVEWAPPSGTARSLRLTTADPGAAGASLTTDSELSYINGTGGSCIER